MRAQVAAHRSAGRGLLSLLVLMALLAAGALLALPYVVEQSLPRLLARHGVTLSLGELEVEPTLGALVLHQVRASHGDSRLSAERLAVRLDLPALLGGDLHLLRVDARRGELVLERDPAAGWTLLGADPRELLAHFPLGTLDAADMQVAQAGGALPPARLARLSVQGPLQGGAGTVRFSLAGAVGPAGIRASGRIGSLQQDPELELLLSVSGLSLEHLAGGAEAQVRGIVNADLNVSGTWSAAGPTLVAEGDVRARSLSAPLQALRLRDALLGWQGRVEASFESTWRPVAASARGHLVAQRARLSWPARSEGELRLEDLQWDGRLAWSPGAGLWGGLGLNGDAAAARLAWRGAESDRVVAQDLTAWGARRQPGGGLTLGGVRIAALSAQRAGQGAGSAPRAWSLSGVAVSQAELSAASAVRLGSLSAGPGRAAGPQGPVALAELRLGEARLEQGSIHLGEAELRGLELGAPPSQEGSPGAPALALGRLSGFEIEVEEDGTLRGRSLRLDDMELSVRRTPDGALQPPPYAGKLLAVLHTQTLEVAGRSSLRLHDETFEPPANLALGELHVQVLGAGAQRRLSVQARDPAGAELSVSGSWPAGGGQAPPAALEARLGGVSLAPLSPYAGRALGLGLQAGRLAGRVSLRQSEDLGWGGTAVLSLSGARVVPGEGPGPGWSPPMMARALGLLLSARGGLSLALEWEPGAARQALERILARQIEDYYGELGLGARQIESLLREGETVLSAFAEPRADSARLRELAARLAPRPAVSLELCGSPGDVLRAARQALSSLDEQRVSQCETPPDAGPVRLKLLVRTGAGQS